MSAPAMSSGLQRTDCSLSRVFLLPERNGAVPPTMGSTPQGQELRTRENRSRSKGKPGQEWISQSQEDWDEPEKCKGLKKQKEEEGLEA